MKDKKSIVILYSKGLYDTNALELASTIENMSKDCYVIAINDDKYANFGKGKVARKSYVFSLRNARWMYDAYSKMTAKKKAPTKPLKPIKADPVERTGMNKFAYELTCRYNKVKNILRRYEPDIVLCFTPSVLKAAIKANEQLRMYTTKIYACLTDFGLDMRFFNRRCSGYIVQNDEIKKKLISLDIDKDKIFTTSIVSKKINSFDKARIREQIGIRNDKKVVFMTGGRYGASIIKSALIYLMDYTDNFNLVVLSGGSSTLVNVARHVAAGNDSIFIVEDVDDIGKLYSIADIVVATPTTCILSETINCGIPLVLLRGVGSVEKDNAKYLLEQNFAYDGTSKEKLILALSDILMEKNEMVDLSKFAKRGTVENVASFLLDKADSVFTEKKILLAEQKLKVDDNTDVIEEVEETMIEEVSDANKEVVTPKGNATLEDLTIIDEDAYEDGTKADGNIDDNKKDSIIDEYNEEN